eukprot:6701319-Pyramimonas_sp.AAC.1
MSGLERGWSIVKRTGLPARWSARAWVAMAFTRNRYDDIAMAWSGCTGLAPYDAGISPQRARHGLPSGVHGRP